MTRAVILAAGEGKRLRPLTQDCPKPLVRFCGQPLLAHQLRVLQQNGILDISVVTGHAAQAFAPLGLRTFHNPDFAQTNMVASLRCAQPLFDGSSDVIVAYGDIVYEPRVLAMLRGCADSLAVVVDSGWERLWRLRMDDPLADAESLLLDPSGRFITELGRKPQSLAAIQGQYIGLFQVSAALAPHFFDAYDRLLGLAAFEGRPVRSMYMTSYLQHLIDGGLAARAAVVRHGWVEIDSVADLQRCETAAADGTLTALFDANA